MFNSTRAQDPAVYFSDDFNSGLPNPNLFGYENFALANGVIRRNGLQSDHNDRRYIRTDVSDYNTRDFRYELTFTTAPLNEVGINYMGIGRGDRRNDMPGFGYNEPWESLYFRVHAPNVAGGVIGIADSPVHDLVILGDIPNAGVHRARIEKVGNAITFSIDRHYNGAFAPDMSHTFSNINTVAPYLDNLNSRLFFGTALPNDYFDDMSIATATTNMTPATKLVAFYDDFDIGRRTASGVIANYSGVSSTESVGGYAGIGTGTNVFSGKFLRNETGMAFPFLDVPASPVIKTSLYLSGLPAHESIDLNFLLAAIDSWDGNTEFASPDVFNVAVDGQIVFSETLDQLNLFDQTYQPPAGVLLTHGTNKGFSQFPDAAYNLGLDSRFDRIPHTSSNLLIEFYAGGAGWTAAYHGDESWGIDNLEVLLNGASTDFNRDGAVDAADFVVWRNLFGQVASGLAADANGNGVVELLDYQLWRADYGKSTLAGTGTNALLSGSSTVPEPPTVVSLVLIAMAGVLARWRAVCGSFLRLPRGRGLRRSSGATGNAVSLELQPGGLLVTAVNIKRMGQRFPVGVWILETSSNT